MSDEALKPADTDIIPAPSTNCIGIDWFIADVGALSVELTPALSEAMMAHAKEFIAAGGQIGWERWALLGTASRAAFREAAEALKIRAVLGDRS